MEFGPDCDAPGLTGVQPEAGFELALEAELPGYVVAPGWEEFADELLESATLTG